MAGLANRVGENHFSQSIGAIWATGRVIPLIQRENACQKDEKPKLKLRPIVVGDTARRILVKAYDAKVRQDVTALCSNHQLNVLKGGYDVGIHAARAELKRCLSNGNCGQKIDFKNNYNSIKRNFFLELIVSGLPQ